MSINYLDMISVITPQNLPEVYHKLFFFLWFIMLTELAKALAEFRPIKFYTFSTSLKLSIIIAWITLAILYTNFSKKNNNKSKKSNLLNILWLKSYSKKVSIKKNPVIFPSIAYSRLTSSEFWPVSNS